ncbi:MAG TPA: alanine racemase [Pseudomonas sp.]|nr:alanine racemase [Pseudomonas sp.]
MFNRRKFVLGSLGVLAGGAAVARLCQPADQGAPHPPYFAALNQQLQRAGIDRPSLLIDLDRLDHNLQQLKQAVAGKRYRIVVKSLPSLPLLNYVAERTQTNAFMVFQRPFLSLLVAARPDADILLGKPFPLSAARTFYRDFAQAGASTFVPSQQLQWLLDTPKRLRQYLGLAQELETRLRINLEIDVGLHRGGFNNPQRFVEALQLIAAHPEHLEFSGLMGYDAHVSGMPVFLAEREFPRVVERYQSYVALARATCPQFFERPLCFNGAGSPTFLRYRELDVLNDISAGSCLMKPTHFDLPILDAFVASSFIATPVLKRLPNQGLPSLEWLGPLSAAWDHNKQYSYFIYGGNWLAEPESPPGLALNPQYISSNQQGLFASASSKLQVDDFVFLRPTQSEAVLLQFGDLLAMRGNAIVERWPVFTARG